MIEVNNLTKCYGNFTAVDNISFSASPGDVLGFLGPNGAGKSTTMKVIAGFLLPTKGSVSVCNLNVVDKPVLTKELIGYLPEGAPNYGEMLVKDFLSFIADIRKLSGTQRETRINYVIEHLQLSNVLNKPIENLSKGFKRRVGLAQAILHDPQVLILDEPTDGLDPNQKHEVRNLIRSMANDKIIVISTHILEEVHAVCNRAMIIADGRILADDTPDGLIARSKYHHAVTLKSQELSIIHDNLQQLNEIAEIKIDQKKSTITAFPKSGTTLFQTINQLVIQNQWKIEAIQLEQGRLDEVFRQITTQQEVA